MDMQYCTGSDIRSEAASTHLPHVISTLVQRAYEREIAPNDLEVLYRTLRDLHRKCGRFKGTLAATVARVKLQENITPLGWLDIPNELERLANGASDDRQLSLVILARLYMSLTWLQS